MKKSIKIIIVLVFVLIGKQLLAQIEVTKENICSRDSSYINRAIKIIEKESGVPHNDVNLNIDVKMAWRVVKKLNRGMNSERLHPPRYKNAYFEYNNYYIFFPKFIDKLNDRLVFGGYLIIIDKRNFRFVYSSFGK
jgi:hypothetical protein